MRTKDDDQLKNKSYDMLAYPRISNEWRNHISFPLSSPFQVLLALSANCSLPIRIMKKVTLEITKTPNLHSNRRVKRQIVIS